MFPYNSGDHHNQQTNQHHGNFMNGSSNDMTYQNYSESNSEHNSQKYFNDQMLNYNNSNNNTFFSSSNQQGNEQQQFWNKRGHNNYNSNLNNKDDQSGFYRNEQQTINKLSSGLNQMSIDKTKLSDKNSLANKNAKQQQTTASTAKTMSWASIASQPAKAQPKSFKSKLATVVLSTSTTKHVPPPMPPVAQISLDEIEPIPNPWSKPNNQKSLKDEPNNEVGNPSLNTSRNSDYLRKQMDGTGNRDYNAQHNQPNHRSYASRDGNERIDNRMDNRYNEQNRPQQYNRFENNNNNQNNRFDNRNERIDNRNDNRNDNRIDTRNERVDNRNDIRNDNRNDRFNNQNNRNGLNNSQNSYGSRNENLRDNNYHQSQRDNFNNQQQQPPSNQNYNNYNQRNYNNNPNYNNNQNNYYNNKYPNQRPNQYQHPQSNNQYNQNRNQQNNNRFGGAGVGGPNAGHQMHPQQNKNQLPPPQFANKQSPQQPLSNQLTEQQIQQENEAKALLEKLTLENNYNPATFDLNPKNAKYFIIKSYSEDDIHRSIKYSIWCSTEHGNIKLDNAFRDQGNIGPIYLFYSVNGSGHFCGIAQMVSPVDYNSSSSVWCQDKWKGQFRVKWIYVKDVPNSELRHIVLENNDFKPVTNSRDTQEVPPEKGRAVLKIIHSHKHKTSIFDDFFHYERKQNEELGGRRMMNDSPLPSSSNQSTTFNKNNQFKQEKREQSPSDSHNLNNSNNSKASLLSSNYEPSSNIKKSWAEQCD